MAAKAGAAIARPAAPGIKALMTFSVARLSNPEAESVTSGIEPSREYPAVLHRLGPDAKDRVVIKLGSDAELDVDVSEPAGRSAVLLPKRR